MAITTKDVDHIATLARLEFSEEETEKLGRELAAILEYIEKLNELDTDNIEPTSHVLDIVSVMRADEAKPGLGVDTALKNAPDSDLGHFKVPRIIES